jgi:hypothetical protein
MKSTKRGLVVWVVMILGILWPKDRFAAKAIWDGASAAKPLPVPGRIEKLMATSAFCH